MPLLWAPKLSSYEYTSIDPLSRGFRLVRLLTPLHAFFGDTPRLEIITVDLDTACSYDTLSYAWGVEGSNLPDRKVIIETGDGQRELLVYKSLETALLNIKTNRPIFVDQLCINQHDNEEKAVQVKLMRDIYTKCYRVVVWLGPETKRSNAYFDFTRRVCEQGTLSRLMGPNRAQFKQVFDAVMDSGIEVDGSVREDRDDLLKLVSDHGSRFPLYGSKDVLDRLWFTRLWIIQEISLAPEAIFVCGSRSLCLDCFRSGMLFYTVYNTYWIGRVKTMSQREVFLRNEVLDSQNSFIRIFQERRAIHLQGQRQTLHSLVLKYSVNDVQKKIGVTKEEDRLYGIMGLAEIQSLSGIRVQYGDPQRAYTDFAAKAAAHDLDIILYNQSPKRLDLPSWVPDWSMELSIPHGYWSLQEPVYTAGGSLREAPQIDIEAGSLTVKGIIIDEIVQVGTCENERNPDRWEMEAIHYPLVKLFWDEVYDFVSRGAVEGDAELATACLLDFGLTFTELSDENPETAEQRLKAARGILVGLGQRYINDRNNLEAYSIFRIATTTMKRLNIFPWYWRPWSEMDELYLWARKPMSAFKKCIEAVFLFTVDIIGLCRASMAVILRFKLTQIKLKYSSIQFNGFDAKKICANAGLGSDVPPPDISLYSTYLGKNLGQRVYLTKRGHVGTGPRSMREGDMAVIIFGSTVPHLLRRNEEMDAWSYVGESYCYGAMDGQFSGDEVSFTII